MVPRRTTQEHTPLDRLTRRRMALGSAAMLAAFPARAAAYDPLAPLPRNRAADLELDLVVRDRVRERALPVLVRCQARAAAMPVVIFSHGLGGARTGNDYLAQHWVGRGYVAVFLQHPGSDEAVWRDKQPGERIGAMRAAASFENLILRMRDVVVVLDTLADWNADVGHPLAGRLDLARIGLAGHSFGASTTQAVSGQRVPRLFPGKWPDPRIKAAIAMSPSAPRRSDPREAFSTVRIPWLLMTGTHDGAIIGDADVANRLSVFPALPPGSKYELVLNRAEHSAFNETPLPGDRLPRNPNHHRSILALSTAFWDAHLAQNPDARAWLDGPGPRGVLEPSDRWQRK